jgi:hypothetical protein
MGGCSRQARPRTWTSFGALRGGGGNFGVVTSFEYQVHLVGPVLAGMIVWPLAQANAVLRQYRDISLNVPDELRLDVAIATTPGGPGVAIIVCWCGEMEQDNRPFGRWSSSASR